MGERRVYIVLTDTGTAFTRLIKLYTKKPYNHASLSFDEKLTEVYSFGRKLPQNPFIGGFVKENLQQGLFKDASCRIYSCQITESQYREMQQVIKNIEKNQHHYTYNLLGLLGFVLNKPITKEHAYFCSEFVATVLKEGGILNMQKSPSLIAPHDFQSMSSLQLEYQGKIADYPLEQSQVHEKVLGTANRLIRKLSW